MDQCNTKLLNINILYPSDTHTYVCVSRGYNMLMRKNFALHNFGMIPILKLPFLQCQKLQDFQTDFTNYKFKKLQELLNSLLRPF